MADRISYIRNLIEGIDKEVPLYDGKKRQYVNFDNAATTPPFKDVIKSINDFGGWYSSVHRGTGYKSQVSTKLYGYCREIVSKFIGANPDYHTVIFCNNTTDGINRVCYRLNLEPDEVVLTTFMEHHSNQLPWRCHAGNIDYVEVCDEDGSLDIDSLKKKLQEHKGKVRLMTVTGASNITGIINPIKEIAKIVHQEGALLFVDAAQFISHRQVTMGSPDDLEHIDFIAFSAHKMYAPFGLGVLVGPKNFFENGEPAFVGGGTVELVTLTDIIWADTPEKEEPGSPNLFGALALAKSIKILQSISIESISEHEKEITKYALERLNSISNIKIFGINDVELKKDRVGVIPILSEEYPHSLLAAILSYEYGIGVRHGCFCAHSYITRLFKLTEEVLGEYIRQVKNGDRKNLPGLVRISFGIYNTKEEIDYLISALNEIFNNGPKLKYVIDKNSGEYFPENSQSQIDLSFLI